MNLKFSAKVVKLMNCNEIKDMFQLYIDDELDGKEKMLVEEHLEKCENCRKELEEYEKIKLLLKNMVEQEPPKGYCNRLHEKLLKTKVKNKFSRSARWMKYGSIAASIVLLIMVVYLSSNDRYGDMLKAENGNSYDDITQAVENSPESPMSNEEYNYEIADNNSSNSLRKEKSNFGVMKSSFEIADERELKIIKSGNITIQTEGYDAFLDNLINRVSELDGYIEQNNTNVNNVYQDRKLKYGYLVIRVPQNNFYKFLNYLEESSEINQKNILETDVTKEYYEKDNKVKNLELQEVNLRELFEKADTVEELLLIENELRRIRTEIDALNISLSDIDDRASMSTITLDVEEVLKANLTMSDRDSVWERARDGFINTINGIVEICENLIIILISMAPVLVPVIIILIVIYIRLRKNIFKK